jgi:ABC-2 type transport system permease protein
MNKITKKQSNLNIAKILGANKGLKAVIRKEVGDHLSGKRFIILSLIIAITCLGSVYVALSTIRSYVGQDEIDFVFLKLFTTSGSSMPFSFLSFISFLGPLLGLALGFDAINGERDRRTLSRILSQPIFRDALINGKFIASLIVISIMIYGLGFLVAGLGITFTGIPPTLEEIFRLLAYLTISIIYIAFWLSLSILLSLLFRQTSTSVLAGIAIWLFLAIFFSLIIGMAADGIYPIKDNTDTEQILANSKLKLTLNRISPTTLYGEAVSVIMNPSVRTLGPVLLYQTFGAIKGSLSFGQSLLIIWPHLVGLIAAALVCFALAYIKFMKLEIRA